MNQQTQTVNVNITGINKHRDNVETRKQEIHRDWVCTGYSGSQLQLKNIKLDKGGLTLMHLMEALIDKDLITKGSDTTSMIEQAKRVANRLRVLSSGKAYRPNEGAIVKLDDGIYVENSWADNGVKGIVLEKADSNNIQKYVTHLEQTIGKEEANYLLDLSAYQTQQHFLHGDLIEAKPQIACAFISEEHGVGKGTHVTFMQEALGISAVKTVAGTKALVFDKSNPQYWSSTFVVCDEAETTFREGVKFYQELKAKTGLTTYQAEIKYENSSTHYATAVPMILTNGKITSALHWLPTTDRRIFVTEWKRLFEDDQEQSDYMEGLRTWFYEHDGAGQLKHLLLTRDWEGNGFKPSNRAPKTEAFYKATQANSDDVIDEIKNLVEEFKSTRRKYIFNINAFDEIFDKFNIRDNRVRKNKLQEAGPVQTANIKIQEAQRTTGKYWVNEGTKITKDKANKNCILGEPLNKCLEESGHQFNA